MRQTLFFILLAIGCANAQTASISGRVRLTNGDVPDGVYIALFRDSIQIADEQWLEPENQARFKFENLPAGTYRLLVYVGDSADGQFEYPVGILKVAQQLQLEPVLIPMVTLEDIEISAPVYAGTNTHTICRFSGESITSSTNCGRNECYIHIVYGFQNPASARFDWGTKTYQEGACTVTETVDRYQWPPDRTLNGLVEQVGGVYIRR